jgi:hypothetical protein
MKKIDLDEVIYGREFLYLFMQDTLLSFLAERDYYPLNTLYGQNRRVLVDFEIVMNNLLEDKMISTTEYNVSITLKGKMKVANGGYKRESLNRRIAAFVAVTGCIAALIAAVFLVLSFLC